MKNRGMASALNPGAFYIMFAVSIWGFQAGFSQEVSAPAGEYLVLSGAYMGQKAPGLTPVQFAPDIIPVEGIQHCFPAFSPDGKEVYWTTFDEKRKPSILFMEERGGRWTTSQTASFSGEHIDQSPVFSSDGQRLYFSSTRPGGFGKRDLWYIEKTENGWSEPINFGSPPNSDLSVSQVSFTADGTIYYVSRLEGTKWNRGIYRSRMTDGKYAEAECLSELINSEAADYCPYIAPDESYLLFASSRPGTKSVETDMYISFRKPDDTWTEPQNMGPEINNGKTVTFPFVTHDGKHLFFNRFTEDTKTDAFFWVDSKIIDRFRPPQNKS